MFHDRARIHVKAGRGGDGALTFRREKHVPKGGPDGGDGGRGGDVVAVADADLRDLSGFRAKRRFKAGRGGNGGGSGKHGADGASVELGCPVGTQILDEDGGLVADLAQGGARVVLARGGGGRAREPPFRHLDAADAALRGDGPARRGERVELRLKLLADAALVGLAERRQVVAARGASRTRRPKVAEYPFTTIAAGARHRRRADGAPARRRGRARPDRGSERGRRARARVPRAPGARARARPRDRRLGGRPCRALRADRPRAACLRRRPRRAAADRRPEQGRPAPRAAGVRASRTSAILRVYALSCATGAGVEDSAAGSSSSCPPSAEPVDASRRPGRVPRLPAAADARRAFRVLRTDRGYRVAGRPPRSGGARAALRAAGAKSGDEVVVGDETLELR